MSSNGLNGPPYLKPATVTFISAQGPMLHTTEHFLQMLGDHKIDMVIMLTNLIESQNKSGDNHCKLQHRKATDILCRLKKIVKCRYNRH